MAKLRFRCRRRRSRSCSSSSSRVHCRVRLGGTGGQRSLRVMPRASRWPTLGGGGRRAGLHPAPPLEQGVYSPGCPTSPLQWGSTCLGTPAPPLERGSTNLGSPTPALERGSTLPGRPETWQGGHCSARRRQVNLAEPGFDLRLLDEQLLRNIPAPQLPQDVPAPRQRSQRNQSSPKGNPASLPSPPRRSVSFLHL